jgi:hypothetical protein
VITIGDPLLPWKIRKPIMRRGHALKSDETIDVLQESVEELFHRIESSISNLSHAPRISSDEVSILGVFF